MAIDYQNIYDYLINDEELTTLLDGQKIAWAVKPENENIGITYRMISNPMIEGSVRTWQRWLFLIESENVLKCKNIAYRLKALLHNIRGDVGGCLINYSILIGDEDPELNENNKYQIAQNYRISTHS